MTDDLKRPRVPRWMRTLPIVIAMLAGCTAAPQQPTDDDADDQPINTTGSKAFASPGGTSGLSVGTSGNGAAVLTAFDPGAFVQAADLSTDDQSDSLDPAQAPPEGGAPPDFQNGFVPFVFGPPPGGPGGPLPPGTPPPGLPPRFFEFSDQIANLNNALPGLLPPPGAPFPPGTPPPPGGPVPPPFLFVKFEDIADLLPPGFVPPGQALALFEEFGANHPLIGQDGQVNPDLETAMFDHPPIPRGFEAFDFVGDKPQFDDIFTVYDGNMVGETQRGQVNTTASGELPDGTPLQCSDTTVIETVLGEATPLVEMGPGVFQAQWVVNIRQLTNSHFTMGDPLLGPPQEFERTLEILSQMTWTLLQQEVDSDGDGVVDKVEVTGSNTIELIEQNISGDAPDEFPAPPPIQLPFEFDGVLDLAETAEAPTAEDGINGEDSESVADENPAEPQ